ncbi:hypothetical protein C496_14687 [Natronorubrum tibetense GA33]|uniref:Uncharacterized protein n=1 Tax=Natronorubrum tibetense GA33 TaxID=1114856 RepID=L9VS81_9EURY|nr:hypothetical protein C496_14687 [Natronorubrum tibetense GA33]
MEGATDGDTIEAPSRAVPTRPSAGHGSVPEEAVWTRDYGGGFGSDGVDDSYSSPSTSLHTVRRAMRSGRSSAATRPLLLDIDASR